jgi:hypothetical protein
MCEKTKALLGKEALRSDSKMKIRNLCPCQVYILTNSSDLWVMRGRISFRDVSWCHGQKLRFQIGSASHST